jgi:hypothetical protein
MNVRVFAVAAPARPRLAPDHIVVAAAIAFAALSVLVTWQTFSPGRLWSGISDLEVARQVQPEVPHVQVGAAQAPDRLRPGRFPARCLAAH